MGVSQEKEERQTDSFVQGAASSPKDDLITPIRRSRKHHSLTHRCKNWHLQGLILPSDNQRLECPSRFQLGTNFPYHRSWWMNVIRRVTSKNSDSDSHRCNYKWLVHNIRLVEKTFIFILVHFQVHVHYYVFTYSWLKISLSIHIIFFYENISCGYSFEAPQSSNEYSQHIFSWKNKKISCRNRKKYQYISVEKVPVWSYVFSGYFIRFPHLYSSEI